MRVGRVVTPLIVIGVLAGIVVASLYIIARNPVK